MGSKAAWIIGETNVPVMAIPLLREWYIPQNILMAVNNFEENPNIARSIFQLAALFKATVHIAIFSDSDSAEAIDYLKHKRSITAYEEKLKTKYKHAGIKSVHLNGHRFQETIEEYILEQRVVIVAMVTHKRTFMERIFSPGITKKMSYHTRIPLLVIPA